MEEATTKKEDKALSVLEQIKQEREAVEEAIKQSQNKIDELRELRAQELLSGKSDAGKKQNAKEPEISDLDYARKILAGKL